MDSLATEQDLDREAEEMLSSWNRDAILKEVDLERNGESKTGTAIEFYDGKTEFSTVKQDMTPVDDKKYVHIKITKKNPDGKRITIRSSVLYDCTYYLECESTPVSSTTYVGKPCRLDLMSDSSVPGLIMGLIEMREGEQANILIHPALAYGPTGCIPLIPPDAYLYYQVKIHKVFEDSILSRLLESDREAAEELDVKDAIALVSEHKNLANKYKADGLPKIALVQYKEGIKVIESYSHDEIMRCSDLREYLITLSLNAAIILNDLGQHKSATKHAKRALKYDDKNMKVYYHLIKARIGLSDYKSAIDYLERAVKIWPNTKCFDSFKIELEPVLRNCSDLQTDLFKTMSKTYA